MNLINSLLNHNIVLSSAVVVTSALCKMIGDNRHTVLEYFTFRI